jgi:hypothetical protein
MAGGLLNLVAEGKENRILNGNPSKTFFKTTYAKYTNFGLQKYRIDVQGQTKLNLCDKSTFRFKVPRYADLLMDTYFVMTLPNIWSPMYLQRPYSNDASNCQPYEFKWIENIGSSLIHRITYYLNDNIIQEFTGDYLYSMVQRDFSNEKKDLFNNMTGHDPELNDPANYSNRNGNYPNVSYNGFSSYTWPHGLEPSIRERQLYIPLNIWSTLSSKVALPLVSMQYSTLYIEVECRPIEDLFVLRDINQFITNTNDPSFSDISYNKSRGFPVPHIHPSQNIQHNKLYYFLKEPLEETYGINGNPDETSAEYRHYAPWRTDWDADVHLIGTYVYLSNDEVRKFATECQSYLIREVHEQTLYNLVGSYKRLIQTIGLVSSWMWYFQRSDVKERNQWTNYSNWPYDVVPKPPTIATRWEFFHDAPKTVAILEAAANLLDISINLYGLVPYPEPCNAVCPPNEFTNFQYITGEQHIENEKNIMLNWGFNLDGKVREIIYDNGVYNYIEKYVRTAGNAKDGLYCYNFCLNTDPFQYQPSGAINMSMFTNVEWEFNTITPVDASNVSVSITCDASGNPELPLSFTSADKNYWRTFKYSYNLHIMEERYNILHCENGVGNLVLSRM